MLIIVGILAAYCWHTILHHAVLYLKNLLYAAIVA